MEDQIGGMAADFLTQEERARLVGLCRKLTGNADVAEDLAQETLLLAWRGSAGLREPQKRAQWIAGIARNLSLRWLRQQGRNQVHSIILSQNAEEPATTTLEELVADEFDLEIELERRELATLLDRALALLPEETRTVLVKRFIEESPLAEIAAQLDTNPSAIAMRLQRGKLALRKMLTSEMHEEIVAYKQAANEQTWEQTSLWCHHCGKYRLSGRKQPEEGLLYLKCPACSPGDEVLSKNESVPVLKGIKSFKPAYARLSEWCHAYYRQGLRDSSMLCNTCGRRMSVKLSSPTEICLPGWLDQETPLWVGRRSERLLTIFCPHCRDFNCCSLEGLIISLPEGRAFLNTHQRIHLLPNHTIDFAGRPAIVTCFASVTDSARFEVISDYATYEVLKIAGGGQ